MNLNLKNKPRIFSVGLNNEILIKDLGSIKLEANEQLTFISETGSKYDFSKKSWGYYATQSINNRLLNEGFKTALVLNKLNRIFIMVVEKKFMKKFIEYCESEDQKVLIWLEEFEEVKKRFSDIM